MFHLHCKTHDDKKIGQISRLRKLCCSNFGLRSFQTDQQQNVGVFFLLWMLIEYKRPVVLADTTFFIQTQRYSSYSRSKGACHNDGCISNTCNTACIHTRGLFSYPCEYIHINNASARLLLLLHK